MRKRRHHKESNLKLTTKVHTGFGIASFSLGVTSVILFIVASCISAFGEGDMQVQQYTIGIIEIIAFVSCIIGIIYGIIGETTKETFKLFANLGLAINIIILMFHIIVLVKGY